MILILNFSNLEKIQVYNYNIFLKHCINYACIKKIKNLYNLVK